jgi:hypothetical protein
MIARFPIVLMVVLGATASIAEENKPVSSEQKEKILVSTRSGPHGKIISIANTPHVGKRISPVRRPFNAAPPAEKQIRSDPGGAIFEYAKYVDQIWYARRH